MSALAQILGRLVGEPRTYPTKTGGQLTAFKLRVVNGSNIEFWEVITFSDSAREDLEGLNEGASVSAAGILEVGTYEWHGETRLKLKLVADGILALKPKKTEMVARDKGAGPPREATPVERGGFDDAIPF
jgi:hypothetical protein